MLPLTTFPCSASGRSGVTTDDIAWLEKLVEQRFHDREEALKAALNSMEHRLAGMNEFRDSLRDQTGTFVSRGEHDQLARQISEMRTAVASMQSRLTTIAAIIAFAVSLLSIGANWLRGSH